MTFLAVGSHHSHPLRFQFRRCLSSVHC